MRVIIDGIPYVPEPSHVNHAKTLGEIIRDARLAMKITAKGMGKLLDSTAGNVYDIERNRFVPSPGVIFILSQELGLDCTSLCKIARRDKDKYKGRRSK